MTPAAATETLSHRLEQHLAKLWNADVRVHDLAQTKGHEQTPVWNKPGLEFADFVVAVTEKP